MCNSHMSYSQTHMKQGQFTHEQEAIAAEAHAFEDVSHTHTSHVLKCAI